MDTSVRREEVGLKFAKHSSKLVRYGIVGLLTFVLYLGVGELLQNASIRLSILAPVAFTAAITFNYLLQRIWVFADERPLAQSFPRYFLMICVGYLINSVVLMTLAPWVPLSIAQLLAVVLIVVSNALFSFFFVFR